MPFQFPTPRTGTSSLLLTQPELADLLGLAPNSLRRLLKAATDFPRPVELMPGARPRWRRLEVEQWLAERGEGVEGAR